MIYGALEIEIMNSMWNMQEQNEDVDISVADIVQNLSENDMNRAYTTIKTVMDRLVQKGLLVRYKNGKKYFYKTTLDRSEAAKKSIEEVSKQFFNGSYTDLLRFVEKECEFILA